jgi:GTP cyclohydrolase II
MNKILRSQKKIKEYELIKLQSEIEEIEEKLSWRDYKTKSEILDMWNVENWVVVSDSNKTMKCSLKVKDWKVYIDWHEWWCDRTWYKRTRLWIKLN